MTLSLATLALYLAAAGAALLLARSCRRHRPVAWYLCAIVVVDALRWGRELLLPASTGPRAGWELVARHADQGLYLAAILALPAMSVAVFGGIYTSGEAHQKPICSRVYIPGIGLLLWAFVASSYPELRGPALLQVYHAVELGAVVASVGCVVTWLRSERPRLGAPELCGLALISGSAAVCVLPALTKDTMLEQWPFVVATNATMLAIVLVAQLRALANGGRAWVP